MNVNKATKLVDYGSGTGKLAMQAFLECPNLEHVIGVELSPSRSWRAFTALSRLYLFLLAQEQEGKSTLDTQKNGTEPDKDNKSQRNAGVAMSANKKSQRKRNKESRRKGSVAISSSNKSQGRKRKCSAAIRGNKSQGKGSVAIRDEQKESGNIGTGQANNSKKRYRQA